MTPVLWETHRKLRCSVCRGVATNLVMVWRDAVYCLARQPTGQRWVRGAYVKGALS